jgi:cell filamentation protein
MPDSKYCYPNSDVLINKLNIQNGEDLFNAEKELTLLRLQELQDNPIDGNFDFEHLKNIHHYIFQDIYKNYQQ